MKRKSFVLYLCTFVLGVFMTSCDDNADDPKYRSLPPEFTDMTFKQLNSDNDSIIKAGEKFVATGEQKKKGRLLNRTIYNWTATPVNVTHQFRKEVIYDKESFNPTDTIVFENPGVYKLTFTGRYYTSGIYKTVSKIVYLDKGKITYKTPTFQYYDVIIEKRIVVK